MHKLSCSANRKASSMTLNAYHGKHIHEYAESDQRETNENAFLLHGAHGRVPQPVLPIHGHPKQVSNEDECPEGARQLHFPQCPSCLDGPGIEPVVSPYTHHVSARGLWFEKCDAVLEIQDL
jgi:hypothetical protein